MVPILWSLSWVLSRFSIMRQRKLARTGETPGCLHAAQESDQSVEGEASSALQGVNCLSRESKSGIIVRKSSVSSLVQSFSVMVTMFKGVSSLSFFIVANSSGVR